MTLEDRFDSMLYRIRSRLSGKKRSSSVDFIIEDLNDNDNNNNENENDENQLKTKAYASFGAATRRRNGYDFGGLGDSIRRSINTDRRKRRNRRRSGSGGRASLSASQRSRWSTRGTEFQSKSNEPPMSNRMYQDYGIDERGGENGLLTTIMADNFLPPNENLFDSNEYKHIREAAVDVGSDAEADYDSGYLLKRLPSIKTNITGEHMSTDNVLSPYSSPIDENQQWSTSLRELERTIRNVIKNSESVMDTKTDSHPTVEFQDNRPRLRRQPAQNGSAQSLLEHEEILLKDQHNGRRMFSSSSNTLYRRDSTKDEEEDHLSKMHSQFDVSPFATNKSNNYTTNEGQTTGCLKQPNTPFHESTYFPINDAQPPLILQRRHHQRRETNRYGGYVPPERRESRDSIGLLYNNGNNLALAENASLNTIIDPSGEKYHEIEIEIRRESSGYGTAGGGGTTVDDWTEPDEPLSKSTSPNAFSSPGRDSTFTPSSRKVAVDFSHNNQQRWPALERRADMPKLDAKIVTRPRVLESYDGTDYDGSTHYGRKTATADYDKASTAAALHRNTGSNASLERIAGIHRDYNKARSNSSLYSDNDSHLNTSQSIRRTVVDAHGDSGYGMTISSPHDKTSEKVDEGKAGSMKVFKIFGVPIHRKHNQKDAKLSKMRSGVSPKSLQSLDEAAPASGRDNENASITSSVAVPWWNVNAKKMAQKEEEVQSRSANQLLASLQNDQERQRRYRYTDLAKSEQHLNRIHRTFSTSTAVDFLRERIKETKYVTAVFESAAGGLAPILADIVKEFRHWLGPASRLLAVACEVHWSVPERQRSRAMEIKFASRYAVLRPLLLNSRGVYYTTNHRVLGIYRRYYPDLLLLQDPKTIHSHRSYWTLENLVLRSDDEIKRGPLLPAPAKFLHRSMAAAQLARKSVVAINMATLRLDGDATNYDAERLSLGSQRDGLI